MAQEDMVGNGRIFDEDGEGREKGEEGSHVEEKYAEDDEEVECEEDGMEDDSVELTDDIGSSCSVCRSVCIICVGSSSAIPRSGHKSNSSPSTFIYYWLVTSPQPKH